MQNLLVISSYPARGTLHGHKFSAVAGYAKNTLDAMDAASGDRPTAVLADVLDEPETYREENREVVRCWRRNDWFTYPRLLWQVLRHRSSRKILLEFEFGMFGNKKVLVGLLPLFILTLRLLGRQVYLVSHGVITSAAEVSDQLGLDRRSPVVRAYDWMLRSIYRFLVLFSNRTIVFEEYLRQKLLGVVTRPQRVVVIPHGVETRQTVPQAEARRQLGLDPDAFIAMSFGFLIWYKGTDWLAEHFATYRREHPDRDARLILAGGASNVHKTDPVYSQYIEDLYERVGGNDALSITGYLAEEEIDLYFSACDLVVLPYRVLISASGPFSFALSHRKPFLLSAPLRGYLDSPDFEESVTRAGLSKDDLFFDLDQASFDRMLGPLVEDRDRLDRLQDVSASLARHRAWQRVGEMYNEAIAGKKRKANQWTPTTRVVNSTATKPAARTNTLPT
jgi:glycosyltransferase involved in cell wall biosynthesis